MKHRRITEHRVRALKPTPGRRQSITEDGLRVEVQPSGRISFYARYRQNGRSYKEYLGAYPELSVKAARQKVLELQHALQVRQEPVAQSAATFRQFVEGPFKDWCEAQRKDGKATIKRIEFQYLNSPIADRRLRDIGAEDVENLKSTQMRTYKPSTVKRNLGDLRRVFSKAVEWSYLRKSPASSVSDPKVDRKGQKLYLSAAELKRLNKALDAWSAKGHFGKTYNERKAYPLYLPPLVYLLINTGLRKGEALALRWRDVDQQNKLIRVRGAITKTGETREVPISDKLLERLVLWNTDAGVEEGFDTEELIFPVRSFRRAWDRLMAEAKLDITPHHLRHHFASTLVLLGESLNLVRELLGHADISTTQIYLSVRSEDKAKAVNLL